MLCLLVLLATSLWVTVEGCEGGELLAKGLNCTEKQLIVDFHNKLREKVAAGNVPTQPSAVNMTEMRWSEELAIKAQEWSERCEFEHETDLEIDGEQIGQNLAIKRSVKDDLRTPELKRKIQRWFDEVTNHGYEGEYKPESGHYSQLIWGSSNLVGCGLTYFKKNQQFNSYLVCDYIQAGNRQKRKPYEYGQRDCQKYNMSDSTHYPHLCSNGEEDAKLCDYK